MSPLVVLVIVSAAIHLVVGVREAIVSEPLAWHPSAWQLLYQIIPEPLWILAWLIVGTLFALALVPRLAKLAVWGFRGSALILAVWALGSGWSHMVLAGASMAQTLMLAYLAWLQWTTAITTAEHIAVVSALDELDTRATAQNHAGQS